MLILDLKPNKIKFWSGFELIPNRSSTLSSFKSSLQSLLHLAPPSSSSLGVSLKIMKWKMKLGIFGVGAASSRGGRKRREMRDILTQMPNERERGGWGWCLNRQGHGHVGLQINEKKEGLFANFSPRTRGSWLPKVNTNIKHEVISFS